MIPLSIAVKISFKNVIWDRKQLVMPREVRATVIGDPTLSFSELMKIKQFISLNCPQFSLSDFEIKTLFISFQKKRPKKIKRIQLSLFS